MDKCKKIMKVAYLVSICISVLFFVFSCLLSIPPSYIEAAKEGVTILSALSMLPNAPAWLSISGIIVAVVAMSNHSWVRTLALLKVPQRSSKQHYSRLV